MENANKRGAEELQVHPAELESRYAELRRAYAKLEEALRESEARYRAVAEDQSELIVRYGTDGGLTFVNEAYARYYGKSPMELVGSGFVPNIPEPDLSRMRECLDGITLENPVVVFDHRIVMPGGDVRWQQWRHRGIYSSEGRFMEYQAVGSDITERKRLEAEIRQAGEAAEAAGRAKSAFLAGMTHEIRTPIAAIMGMTDMALSFGPSVQVAECLQAGKDSCSVLLHIVDDILDLSRIEAGRLELEHAEFKLGPILSRVLEMHKAQALRKGLSLHLCIAPTVPAAFLGDATRLGQVVWNLVGNAVKFTDEGEIQVHVESMETARGAGGEPVYRQLGFTVSDTGEGIPEERQSAIFESFKQLDGSLPRELGRVGLGLAVCKQLVEMMGGEIWVESKRGKGSRFGFTVLLEEKRDLSGAAPELPGLVLDYVRKTPALKILLADGNPLMRKVLTHFLSRSGHNVTAVDNGHKVLNALEEERFDLVLMDVQMPHMDGIETTVRIRSSRSGRLDPGIPIVALTACSMRGDRERILEAGMDDYVAKPVQTEELVRVIGLVMARKGDNRRAPAGPEVDATPVGFAELRSKYAGLESLLKDLIVDFSTELSLRLSVLRESLDCGDTLGTVGAAHSLAGIAGVFHASQLIGLARAMEQEARNGRMEEARALYDRVDRESHEYLLKLCREFQVDPGGKALSQSD